ncbi:hypothetical protein FE257_000363 [Aspergillus nanangensis]|uniref:Uncharacterized protein n=1 Tax=Aspergillus nanangensis TaxID=2582783 RepID=A0AAD4CU61_ASPNN|nr:hypothetical protein FE257_000363 [Aspergillus nanangensis]
MAARSKPRLLLALALPPVIATYGIHRGLQTLEQRYPPQPPEQTSSIALRTPQDPSTQQCPHVDIFAARVPLKALQNRVQQAQGNANNANNNSNPTVQDLTTAWAQTFLGSRVFRAEACAIGLFRGAGLNPGDLGDTPAKFSPDAARDNAPRVLANGVAVVVRAPAEDDTNGLLVRWSVPDGPRRFFEKISTWGYPWRLMSGGRHEMSISEPFGGEEEGEGDGGPFVEVRFSSAHDYEVVASEGNCQKVLPEWGGRLHRGYARFLLDIAVRELEKEV